MEGAGAAVTGAGADAAAAALADTLGVAGLTALAAGAATAAEAGAAAEEEATEDALTEAAEQKEVGFDSDEATEIFNENDIEDTKLTGEGERLCLGSDC